MSTSMSSHQLFNLENYLHAQIFNDITYVWQVLSKLEEYLKSKKLGQIAIDIPEGIYLIHPESISIGAGTIIEPGAYIQGPCIIGKNCTIRQGAYIRGNTLIGDRCVIGHSTEVKHSIFLNDVAAAHFNYVGDSILGNAVNLGAGVKCANLNLNRASISVVIDGKKFSTGLKKLGAIIGDNAQIGCNCVINPGTILGKYAICFPCLNVSGCIPDYGKVKPGIKNIVE